MEDTLDEKTFNERQPLMKEDTEWKTILDGRQPLMEDDL